MNYNSRENIHYLVNRQRDFFNSKVTFDVSWRIKQLKKLKSAVQKYEQEMKIALNKDLGRSPSEAFLCDVGSVILELNETIRGLKKWTRPELHLSGLLCFPSLFTRVYKIPYGVTLIISPFNFPFMLSLGVLLASIAGGNTAVVKASSKSAYSTQLLKKIIAETFTEEYVAVLDGGHDVADMCLNERFDKIFYTGSPKVGKHIMTEAAKNLTPVALELGGENGNWAVVRSNADLKDAARKIAFFKILNSGQICIDINQIAVADDVVEKFIKLLIEEYKRQKSSVAINDEEYSHLINIDAYRKCEEICSLYRDRIVYGGQGDENSLSFQPTIIYPVSTDDEIVKRELFNPIVSVVPFRDSDIDSVINLIEEREHGLALYLFTKDIKWANKIMSTSSYGGGCINEVCMHLMVKGVPFNGTGHSGIGAYHGQWGFKEFTHPCTVLRGSDKFNLSLREHPYSGRNLKNLLIRLFER